MFMASQGVPRCIWGPVIFCVRFWDTGVWYDFMICFDKPSWNCNPLVIWIHVVKRRNFILFWGKRSNAMEILPCLNTLTWEVIIPRFHCHLPLLERAHDQHTQHTQPFWLMSVPADTSWCQLMPRSTTLWMDFVDIFKVRTTNVIPPIQPNILKGYPMVFFRKKDGIRCWFRSRSFVNHTFSCTCVFLPCIHL